MCQSASAAGVPVSHHTGLTQQRLCAYDYCYYFHSSHHFLMIVCCCLSQLCIESCPNRHLTLLKAKTNTEDLEYYSRFCKEGVDIRMLVSDQMIWSFTSYTCLHVYQYCTICRMYFFKKSIEGCFTWFRLFLRSWGTACVLRCSCPVNPVSVRSLFKVMTLKQIKTT